MSSAVQDGWDFASKQMGSGFYSIQGADYVNTINDAILTVYKETLEKLSDTIMNGEDVESIPLTREEIEVLALLAKGRDFNPEDFGLGVKELVPTEYILAQALQAGYSANLITLVMQLTPEIFKSIDYLIKKGELDVEQLENTGVTAISASTEGFLRGAVSAVITISCKTGKLGEQFIGIDPHIIGMITVIALDTVKNSILVAAGKMSTRQMGTVLSKEILTAMASFSGGTIGQIILPEFPVLGYMLGSLLGSCIASVTMSVGGKHLISFCADSGFTCFGLVEQDYELPRGVLERLGVNLAEVEHSMVEKSTVNRSKVIRSNVRYSRYETVELVMVRRGVIGLNKIGYV